MTLRRIDAHQHFWRLERGDYGWLTPQLLPIYRDFLPGDLAPLLANADIAGTVLVQAAPTDAETDFLIALAEDHDFIEGVVGWADFGAPHASARIAKLAGNRWIKGLRPMIQDIADADWMLSAELEPAFNALIAHDLVFDALVLPRHLGNLAKLLDRQGDMRTIIDHCAKPDIAGGLLEEWFAHMKALADNPNIWCKLSGLVTEAGPGWSVEILRPYVDHVLDAFGPQRLIWGSDWPVCTLAASYDEWGEATEILLAGCTHSERDAILGGNAAIAYGLDRGIAGGHGQSA